MPITETYLSPSSKLLFLRSGESMPITETYLSPSSKLLFLHSGKSVPITNTMYHHHLNYSFCVQERVCPSLRLCITII